LEEEDHPNLAACCRCPQVFGDQKVAAAAEKEEVNGVKGGDELFATNYKDVKRDSPNVYN
jgi:hypothetical protein